MVQHGLKPIIGMTHPIIGIILRTTGTILQIIGKTPPTTGITLRIIGVPITGCMTTVVTELAIKPNRPQALPMCTTTMAIGSATLLQAHDNENL
jgi:hypothetical protein